MSCGVGWRWGSDPVLLWLWWKPAATALIWPLARESPYATGVALEKAKKDTHKKNPSLQSLHDTTTDYTVLGIHHLYIQTMGSGSMEGISSSGNSCGGRAVFLQGSMGLRELLASQMPSDSGSAVSVIETPQGTEDYIFLFHTHALMLCIFLHVSFLWISLPRKE